MNELFREGAFQARKPEEACFVRRDRETMSQNDIDQGITDIQAGFVPVKPAEVIVIAIQQFARSIEVLRSWFVVRFNLNSQRSDPYKNFKFRVTWDHGSLSFSAAAIRLCRARCRVARCSKRLHGSAE